MFFARGSSISANAGVTVRATNKDARMANTFENANGRKNEPARPSRKKTGKKTRMTIKLA